MDYVIPFESVSVVKVSIDEVVTTLLEALGLVVLVVFLFLQSWRATLIPVLAIPVSIVGTFALFIPLGFTINTLTMFGFVLAIGIVVDDAIIVVEAVQHYIDREHLSPKEATSRAMKTYPALSLRLHSSLQPCLCRSVLFRESWADCINSLRSRSQFPF